MALEWRNIAMIADFGLCHLSDCGRNGRMAIQLTAKNGHGYFEKVQKQKVCILVTEDRVHLNVLVAKQNSQPTLWWRQPTKESNDAAFFKFLAAVQGY